MNFCKESKNCDVLLIEGVSVSFKEYDDELEEVETINENELIEKINNIVKSNIEKQITFNYYISNIERILNIIKTIKISTLMVVTVQILLHKLCTKVEVLKKIILGTTVIKMLQRHG